MKGLIRQKYDQKNSERKWRVVGKIYERNTVEGPKRQKETPRAE